MVYGVLFGNKSISLVVEPPVYLVELVLVSQEGCNLF